MQIKEIIDKNIWEKFIAYYSPQSFFQAWNIGEACKLINLNNHQEFKFWRLGLYEKNKILALAQIIKVRAKRGTFLHIRHGPIFTSWSVKYLNFFFAEIRKLAKSEKASFIRISPLIENSPDSKKILKDQGFRNAPIHQLDGEYCWIINLEGDMDNILSSMRKTTRYLIRQASKLNIIIKKSANASDIKEFLDLYHQTAKRHGFVEHQGIKEEFDLFNKDQQAIWFKGYYNDNLMSMALIIFYNNQAIYHHSASIDQKIPVNYLLQYEVIKEAKERGKKVYNMWGIAPVDNPNHPWKGLTLFKKGFGGRVIEYLHTQDLPVSSRYYYTYLIEQLIKVYKGY